MSNNQQTRRNLVKTLGIAITALPIISIIGCGGDNSDTTNADIDTQPTTEPTTGGSSSTETGDWLVGGTELITENYPDDTLFESATACAIALTGSTTEGPCFFSVDTTEDISTGLTGLPMMLCLRLIDSECNPLANHEIAVWHCYTAGVYSGDTTNSEDSSGFAGDFCTSGDNAAQSSTWYRGELITDSNGRVNFKSCFPGWYSGRTIHIHFSVTNNNASLISQFCFDDTLTQDICNNHSEYSGRGTQDTTLSGGRDTVFGSDYEEFQFETQINSDGSLLAYKTIQTS